VAGTNTIVVNSTADGVDEFSGTCTLREAVRNANLNQSSPIAGECAAGSASVTDVIVLTSGQTYPLTLPNSAANPDETGDLDIGQSLPVGVDLRIETDGPGAATVHQTIAGQRVFDNHGDSVELHNLVVSGGSVDGAGGGLLNSGGFLVLTSTQVLSNSANAGGGIYNDSGGLRIVDSSVELNNATLIGGGGVFNAGVVGAVEVSGSLLRANTAPAGGAIYSNGSQLVIQLQSMLNLNQTSGGDGGAIANLQDSQLIVRDASFDGNMSMGNGGAIHTESSMVTPVSDSLFSDNNATVGGAIHADGVALLDINGSSFLLNSSASDGGAISATFVVVRQSRLEGNEAFFGNGGAIHASTGGQLRDNSLVRGNSAVDGGGLHVQVLELVDSRVENNSASSNGGGVYISNRALVEQARISQNSAINGGGIYLRDSSIFVSEFRRLLASENLASGQGGGLWLGSDAKIGNATVTLNSATAGGGLYIADDADATAVNLSLIGHLSGQDLHKFGTLTLQNSIISTPGQPDCTMGLNNPTITSLGNNIADDASCFGLTEPTDHNSTNPQLEALADSGGNTLTYAPAADSPAVDAGNSVACGADPVFGVDQRGGARAVGSSCDIGAHERGAVVPADLFADGFE
jgi:CSLREA domain-containing protein